MSTNHQSGFTIVEIVTVLAALSIVMVLVFTTLYDLYTSSIQAIQTATQAADTRTGLRALENELNIATGIQATVSPVTTPQGSGNDATSWTFKGTSTTSRVLISQGYATTASATNTSRALVYSNSGGCGSPSISSLAKNTYIYFISAQTLYRRTITPTNTCPPGPFQKSSCAAGQTATICQATDAVILRNISSFTVQYYANAGDSSPVDVYNEPNDAVASGQITSSKAIVVAIETTQTISGIINTYQGSIRINKFN